MAEWFYLYPAPPHPISELAAGGGTQKTTVSLHRRPTVLEFWQLWGFLKAHADQMHPGPCPPCCLSCLGNEANYQCPSLWAAFLSTGRGVNHRSLSSPLSAEYTACPGRPGSQPSQPGSLEGAPRVGRSHSWEALTFTWLGVCLRA